jgi:hypothetical protein
MESKLDSMTVTFLKVLGISIVLASIFAATTVQAEYRPYNYLEQYGYTEELQHCVDLLRPTLNTGSEERASFVVEDIVLRGPWYRFKISASVFSADGVTRVDSFKVSCKSNRWIESARLFDMKNNPSVKRALVVRNSNELVSFKLVAANTSK